MAIPIRTITTAEAKISTVQIEVKAITLNKKQMTLSVFRQLEKEDLIDWATGRLSGVPWGRVNYTPGDCPSGYDHLHVVWQKGGELRRACCYPLHSPMRDYRCCGYQATADNRRVLAAYLFGEHTEPDKTEERPNDEVALTWGDFIIAIPGRAYTLLQKFWTYEARDRDLHLSWHREDKDDFLKEKKRLITLAARAAKTPGQETDPYWAQYSAEYWRDERIFFEGRYNESYQSLSALDQLFIAV